MIVWWLSQEDCQEIGPYLREPFPADIQAEYRSRLGSAGRGRLWAAARFGAVECIPDPPETPVTKHILKCGGIVVDDDLIGTLEGRPGLVTNLKYQLVVVPRGYELWPVS